MNPPDPSNFSELGVDPATAGTVIGGAVVLSALTAVVHNLQDDWAQEAIFRDNVRKLHSAMLGLQCIVGGSSIGQPLVDSYGNTICAGGTKPLCSLPPAQLAKWRTLRESFGKFWSDSTSGLLTTITPAVAERAKLYVSEFSQFYSSIQGICGGQLPRLPDPPPPPEAAPWIKYATWGLGFVALVAVANATKSIWGGNSTVRVDLGQRARAAGAAIKTRASAAGKRMGLGELGETRIKQLRLDESGYDKKGRYWGKGDPVYKVIDDTGYSAFVRAKTAHGANRQFQIFMQDLRTTPRALRRG